MIINKNTKLSIQRRQYTIDVCRNDLKVLRFKGWYRIRIMSGVWIKIPKSLWHRMKIIVDGMDGRTDYIREPNEERIREVLDEFNKKSKMVKLHLGDEQHIRAEIENE